MKRTKIKELLNSKEEQEEVLVKGWVRTRRDSKGGFSFLEINDGSCLANIQVIVEHSLKEFSKLDKQITTGSCLAITGRLVASEG
ncbi:MAG: OB-fold nucleic acid binding domain-containing protein, partial [Nitrospinota bacterium]|nr:OB-fold nucleic acid binding domain-containing protein [Nitrospinota bacterium]